MNVLQAQIDSVNEIHEAQMAIVAEHHRHQSALDDLGRKYNTAVTNAATASREATRASRDF